MVGQTCRSATQGGAAAPPYQKLKIGSEEIRFRFLFF
jgi:hypothetical protein